MSAIAKWIVAGGLAFWLPVYLAAAISGGHAATVSLNLAPTAGLLALAGIYWRRHRTRPSWGWVLAGIYILGPTLILAPGGVRAGTQGIGFQGGWLDLLMLLPPMTLWLALLNGTIFSLLGATVVLPLLAMKPYPKSTPLDGQRAQWVDPKPKNWP